MQRAGHALIMFIAIVALVATTPIVVVKVSTMVLDRVERGPTNTPEWWGLAGTVALPVFAVATLFLIWDSRRIAMREEAGFMATGLRLPVSRRRRRLPRGLR